jgi:hypothetical protein
VTSKSTSVDGKGFSSLAIRASADMRESALAGALSVSLDQSTVPAV